MLELSKKDKSGGRVCQICVSLACKTLNIKRKNGEHSIKHRSAECSKGHIRTVENTTIYGECKICKKERRRERYIKIGK